jgi:arsenite methyltransferase
MGENPAAIFDKWAKEGSGPHMEDAHAYAGKKVLDRITIGYDQSFIDLGCGNGWATRYVAAKVPTIGLCVGLDVSPEFIKEARALSAGKFPVKFLVAPIEEVPFGESSFNHAFSMEALYYAADVAVALKAIWRVLKAGGTFHLVIDFFKENPASEVWQKNTPMKMTYLSEDEWVALFKAAGFSNVAAERILDDRPVAPDMKMPWGGFNTREDLAHFRTKVGSLYLRGTKAELSHALDKVLERANAQIKGEESPPAKDKPRGKGLRGRRAKK